MMVAERYAAWSDFNPSSVATWLFIGGLGASLVGIATVHISLIKLPVCDRDGFPIQQRGVANYAGLYFVGMPWLYKLSRACSSALAKTPSTLPRTSRRSADKRNVPKGGRDERRRTVNKNIEGMMCSKFGSSGGYIGQVGHIKGD